MPRLEKKKWGDISERAAVLWINNPKRARVAKQTNLGSISESFGTPETWPTGWSPELGEKNQVFSSFESQEDLQAELKRLQTVARDNALKHRTAAVADAGDTLTLALEGSDRVFIREPGTASIEVGDTFAFFWNDTGDIRVHAGGSVSGWVDGIVLRKRGTTYANRWTVWYAVDGKETWHDFDTDQYGTDRSEGQRWVFLRNEAPLGALADTCAESIPAVSSLLVEQEAGATEVTAEEQAAEVALQTATAGVQ